MPKTCSERHGLSPPQSMLRFTLVWYLSTALIFANSFGCGHVSHKFAGFGWHKHAQKPAGLYGAPSIFISSSITSKAAT